MSEKNYDPKIRFHVFWASYLLKELGEFSDKLSEKNVDNSIRETFTNSAGFGVISQRDFFDHDIAKQEKINGYYIIHPDDFVYNPRISTTAPCGPINRNRLGRAGVMSPLYTIFKTKNILPLYLEWYFKSYHWHSYMRFNGDSGARSDRFSIKNELFFKMPIPIPDIKEQENLGLFFEELNRIIANCQKKYEKLQALKSSMLEKMFPKDGADVPEVRFNEFSGAWIIHNFKEMTYRSGEKNKSNISYESYSISNEYGFVPQNVQFENGGTMKDADKRLYYIVEPNSFAYNPARINVGSIGYQHLNYSVIVSSLYEIFKTKDYCYDKFLMYYFKTKLFQKQINEYQEGGVRLYFFYDKLCKCSLMMPSYKEQEKIASYFEELDMIITLNQQKLEKLQNLKKALLERMFV